MVKQFLYQQITSYYNELIQGQNCRQYYLLCENSEDHTPYISLKFLSEINVLCPSSSLKGPTESCAPPVTRFFPG